MPNNPRSGVDSDIPVQRGLGWLLSGGWVDREAAGRVFDADPWRGWWGRWPTYLCAHLWCFFVAWPVSFVEVAGIPLLVATLLRMGRNYRYIRSIVLQPLFIAAAVFGIVQFASGWWTLDRRQWLEQAGSIRWLWSLGVLWPFVQRRRALLMTLAAGFLVGNAAQLSQFLHVALGWPTPAWNRAPDRYSGWWPPVVCGTLLVGALGLHLPGALLPGPVRGRVLAAAASLVAFAGIVASGTRGAWLAAAALVVACAGGVLFAALRGRPGSNESESRRGRARVLLIAAVLVIACGAVAWKSVGGSVVRRYELARQEIAAAIEKGDYTSDTGARIGMAAWAIDLFEQHPVIGVGAGSFKPAVERMLSARGVDPRSQAIHDHAHDALLQIAATTGLLGLVPALAVIVIALRNAAALARGRCGSSGAIEWGPAAALVGLLLVSAFDPVHLNAQTAAMLSVLLGLCPSFIPAPAGAERSPRAEARE